MRNATVAPWVAPWRERPSAVGRTPHEQSGSGVPMAEAHRTERILPRPRNRLSKAAGTRTAKTPARTNPSSRKKEASRRIDHASAATWSRNSVTRDPGAERRRPGAGQPAGPRDCEWTTCVTLYLGRYFLSSAQATEYCGSTTLAILMTAV